MATEEEILVMRNVRGQSHWSCLGDAGKELLMQFMSIFAIAADEAIRGFLQQDDRKLFPVVCAKHGLP